MNRIIRKLPQKYNVTSNSKEAGTDYIAYKLKDVKTSMKEMFDV